MRISVVLLLLLGACQSAPEKRNETAVEKPWSRIVQSGSPHGRVASVNEKLQYAVVDYLLGDLPAVGDRVIVYREGRPVGELKVSSFRGRLISADILIGEVEVGDEVRAEPKE